MKKGVIHKMQNKLTGFVRTSRIPLWLRDLWNSIPHIKSAKQSQLDTATMKMQNKPKLCPFQSKIQGGQKTNPFIL
jgi:hypothetical protein